ncbi:hypothetical protein MTR_7g083220 [Medicago truncatula]|uniref:Uncharacterized protein n=1 Tax=Medicago truncatula TaxID=3880 RepID=G7KW56_MEDTR|nr:hypothetical protein MTR_7g083220 [Medicago truncatula]
MQTANQTKPRSSVQKSSEFIRIKCSFLRLRDNFFFSLSFHWSKTMEREKGREKIRV